MDNNNNIFNDRQNYQPQQAQDPQQYQPQYQQPYQQPQYQQPVYQQPPYQQAPYQQPVYQQPVYQQPVYQQPAAPQKPLRPIDLLPPDERAARKKKATVLCVISLILQIAPYILMGVMEALIGSSSSYSGSNVSPAAVEAQILLYAMGGTYIASRGPARWRTGSSRRRSQSGMHPSRSPSYVRITPSPVTTYL